MLLRNDANVYFWTFIEGSALHIASKQVDERMCELLTNYGASPFLEDVKGWTPLDIIV